MSEMSARSRTPTKKGNPAGFSTDEIATEILEPGFHEKKRSKGKTGKQQPVIKAISMKTPGDVQKREMPEAEMPHVKLRALSELSRAQTPQNLGNLAPPYDPHEARKRSVREYAFWACIAVMIGSGIALGVWFIAR